MGSFYCMCEAHNYKPDSQVYGAPNRYCAVKGGDDFPPLALRKEMRCIKTGARQVILPSELDHANLWTDEGRPDIYREHYPNVDVFECSSCGARIAHEVRR